MRQVAEEYEGVLIVPNTIVRQYELGTVLQVGDGINRATGVAKPIPVAVGDTVWFQLNPAMAWHNTTKIDGQVVKHIHVHDALAKITGTIVKIENFQILGSWVLLEAKVKDKIGSILLPSSASAEAAELKYIVAQTGSEVVGLPIGAEAIIDKKMAHIVDIGGRQFFYIDYPHVHGYIE